MIKFNWYTKACSVILLWAAVAIALPAQTLTTLHSFDFTDGAGPNALVQATDGNLYGTTLGGGAGTSCFGGCGTVFKITPSSALTTLYNFCLQGRCPDGDEPEAALVQATDGNFYGTTFQGGQAGNGPGTVFKITPEGALTTLRKFELTNGSGLRAGLVQGTDGNFYGATEFGGANDFGTIFIITPGGALGTLHSFNGTDGADPAAGLLQATDGNFYGTTSGLSGFRINTGGTVFKITPNGAVTTLHTFCSETCPGGADPLAGLIQATDGNFYGTTSAGGDESRQHTDGGGTVFKITPGGTLTTLYNFCSQSGCPDGRFPFAALVQATDGNLYGTTLEGGTRLKCGALESGCGTIFKITLSGALTTLHSFDGTDGSFPTAALIQNTNGSLYGTTQSDGGIGANAGTVFSFSVGLAPFVETQPSSGKVGAAINILGTDLTGATSVTFNGTAALFTVVSPSLISTTVPAGATSGKVQVSIPGGMLSSNVPFRVRP